MVRNRGNWTFLVLAAFVCLLPTETQTIAQEKSVRPDVNKSFSDPDVEKFVERFEREGREVFDARDKIIDACDLQPGMTVADIGAGTGLFTRLFAPRVGSSGHVYAVDIAKNFIDHIQKSCREAGIQNVTGIVCTPTSTELPTQSIDLAFISDTYHHFEFPYRTMRSIYRALRPGGQVVLVEFDRIEGKSSDWILNHVRAGKKVFTTEIETAGFRVIDEKTFMKTSYFLRFEKSKRETASGHTADSLDTVKMMLASKTAVLIDVREKSEWDAGHLEEAQLVPLSQLRAADARSTVKEMLDQLLPKDRIVYCHCRSGGRALVAARILKKLDYDIRPLKWGYADLLKSGLHQVQ